MASPGIAKQIADGVAEHTAARQETLLSMALETGYIHGTSTDGRRRRVRLSEISSYEEMPLSINPPSRNVVLVMEKNGKGDVLDLDIDDLDAVILGVARKRKHGECA